MATKYPVNLWIERARTDPRGGDGLNHQGFCQTAAEAVARDFADEAGDDADKAPRSAELVDVEMAVGFQSRDEAERVYQREIAQGWARVERRNSGWAAIGETWRVTLEGAL